MTYADIKVGTVFFNPPFVASSDSGFDIDLIQEICKRMQEHCTLIPMKYYQLFPALEEGQVNIVIAGIFISGERKNKYLFSLPYLVSNAQILVTKNSTMLAVTELAGKR